MPNGRQVVIWLELPYLISVPYKDEAQVVYREGVTIPLRFVLFNDVVRLSLGSLWLYEKALHEAIERGRRGESVELRRLRWGREYVASQDVEFRVAELQRDENVPLVHIERVETVVRLSGPLPSPATLGELEENAVLPDPGFFSSEVLPKLQSVVDSYRIAALPAMRYAIHPVSEALVDTAYIEVHSDTGEITHRVEYGFDVRSRMHVRALSHHASRLGIEGRFVSIVGQTADYEPERRLTAAYYLFHMRRWAENLAVASAVVDDLVKRLVFTAPERLATALWSVSRKDARTLFNVVLPALWYPQLSEEDQDLWQEFLGARGERGAAVHGRGGDPFDSREAESTKEHLRALYDVARWLAARMGRPWALDVEDQGSQLEAFP